MMDWPAPVRLGSNSSNLLESCPVLPASRGMDPLAKMGSHAPTATNPLVAMLRRRRLLQFGGASYLGLNLGGLWHSQAAGSPAENGLPPLRACILLFYYGG